MGVKLDTVYWLFFYDVYILLLIQLCIIQSKPSKYVEFGTRLVLEVNAKIKKLKKQPVFCGIWLYIFRA